MSRSFRAQRFACGACEDDVEGELVSGQLRCLVCGSVLVAQETHQQQQAGERSPLPGGNNVADALEQLMNRLGPSKAASKRSVASLRRVRPDARSCTLDPQVRLRVEGIEGDCIAVPASFGPLLAPPEEREYSLRECVPRFAETMEIKSNLRDAWALVDRGGDVSFAFKVRACEAAGALGVVLVQTQEVWPFTPTDVKGEAAQWNGGLKIPLIAVSKATGTRLRELLRLQQEGPSLGMKIRLSLLVGESDRMCAVCHDDLVDKTTPPPSELVQMPCLHYFHAHCVMPWLENNNTCPVCRFALETDIATTSSAATPQNDTPSILGWFG